MPEVSANAEASICFEAVESSEWASPDYTDDLARYGHVEFPASSPMSRYQQVEGTDGKIRFTVNVPRTSNMVAVRDRLLKMFADAGFPIENKE